MHSNAGMAGSKHTFELHCQQARAGGTGMLQAPATAAAHAPRCTRQLPSCTVMSSDCVTPLAKPTTVPVYAHTIDLRGVGGRAVGFRVAGRPLGVRVKQQARWAGRGQARGPATWPGDGTVAALRETLRS